MQHTCFLKYKQTERLVVQQLHALKSFCSHSTTILMHYEAEPGN
jgi:hypothetical protein